MIYAVRTKSADYIKIGYTHRLGMGHRMVALQTGCPYELDLLATCDGDRVVEAYYHLKLKAAKAHVRGEWFKWCPEAEAVVADMRARAAEVIQIPATGTSHRRLGKALAFAQMHMKPEGNGFAPGKV